MTIAASSLPHLF
ncbi:unnamed protein product [Acanthoscelides obtectus]|uniref:Uncharacterized protein n=1 Tax=Acanthoscelides obtectus TaxID=200917 RepID=A0A9P0KBE0_ACAOB|nr:unnamed protein product [Acanthoscelides obtectus]CAK1625590.1 hypothetical protein AOBTE_LOCUS3251 [Acanthoscelides obtectus]